MANYLFVITVIAVCWVSETSQSRRVRDVSSTTGNTQTNSRIADYAMRALGSFQNFMKEGNTDLGIPTLDPVHMESFNYSLENSPVGFKMDIQFESPSLMGLSNYELNSASEFRSVAGSKLLMTIVFPTIQIKGAYKSQGNLFTFFALTGQGDFEIVASSQVLSAEAKLSVINETLVVEEIKSQFVGGRVKSQFTDISSSGPFAGLLSEFLSAMGTLVFDNKLKPIITVAMNDYMKEWLNGAFSSVSLNELLGRQTQPQPQSEVQISQTPPVLQSEPQPQVQQLQQVQQSEPITSSIF